MNTDGKQLICIVEDHRFLGQLVALELESFGFATKLFEPTESLSAEILELKPKLILLDVELGPELDSLELCSTFVATGLDVVLFTGVQDTILLAKFLRFGARGILSKTEDLDNLATQVRQAIGGGEVAPSITDRIAMLSALDRHQATRAEALEPFRRLSQSEAEVLAEMVRGLTVAEIAVDRFVSVTTVRAQIRAIHSKLGVSTQLSAVSLASKVGWSLSRSDNA